MINDRFIGDRPHFFSLIRGLTEGKWKNKENLVKDAMDVVLYNRFFIA